MYWIIVLARRKIKFDHLAGPGVRRTTFPSPKRKAFKKTGCLRGAMLRERRSMSAARREKKSVV